MAHQRMPRTFAEFLTDAIASDEFLEVFDPGSEHVHEDDDPAFDVQEDTKHRARTTSAAAAYARRRERERDQELLKAKADRSLCLSGDSHAGVAFQCGALVALQELGQLQRVGVVSASGTGCMVAAALASLWRQTTRHVPDHERTRHTRLTRSWSSVTTRDVSTQTLGGVARQNADEYETVDQKSNDVLALRGSGVLRRNALLVNRVCEPLCAYMNEPHEWRMFWKRLRKPAHWFRSWNHEMIPVIYHRLGLTSIRSGLTMSELCLDKSYSNEPITPIFNLALSSSHTDDLVIANNTDVNKVHEPLDGRIARRHQVALGVPVAAFDLDLSRLLASIALPGPGSLFKSLDWHECDELRDRTQRRLTLGNATALDPLALTAAQMWFEHLVSTNPATAENDEQCLFVLDAFTHSPTFYEHESSLRRATLRKLQDLTSPSSNDQVRLARGVDLRVVQCFDQRLLAHAVNARNPVLEMEVEMSDLTTTTTTTIGVSTKPRSTRVFNTRMTHLPEWYECMRSKLFDTRLSSLGSAAFRAMANWGYVLTYMQYATDVQFGMWQQKNKLLYEPLPSDTPEDERLLTGFGITPNNIQFVPLADTHTTQSFEHDHDQDLEHDSQEDLP